MDPLTTEYRLRVDAQQQQLADVTAALQEMQVQVPIELRELQRRSDVLEEHLPEMLGMWSSYAGSQRRVQRQLDAHGDALDRYGETIVEHSVAIGDRGRSILELWERIEFVRKELMFEFRYSDGRPEPSTSEPLAARIVDEQRLDDLTAAHGLRLNLGCGHLPIDDYVNVDMRELPGVDVVAAIDDLPFEDGSIVEIHSAHVLEHFPEEDLSRRLLPYWYSKLTPGGRFRAVVPDGTAMVEGYVSGDVPFEDLRAVLYGGQEYEGDFHFTMFSPDSLTKLLAGAGFVDIEIEAQGRRNDVCLELQVAALRPA